MTPFQRALLPPSYIFPVMSITGYRLYPGNSRLFFSSGGPVTGGGLFQPAAPPRTQHKQAQHTPQQHHSSTYSRPSSTHTADQHKDHMSSPASSAWGCLGAALSVEPEGLEGRAAFLELVTVVSAAAAQTKTQVKCNLCDKTFTGITTRMAAHFGKKAGYHVSPCTKSTPAAVALGKKFLGDLSSLEI